MKEILITEIQQPEVKEELPTVSQFREFRTALTVIYSTKEHGEAFKRAQPSSLSREVFNNFVNGKVVPQEIAKFYYPDVPFPVDLAELPDEKLEELIKIFGPDIIRAKMVSKSVAEGNEKILPIGGACLIETFGTDLLKGNACKDVETKAETAKQLIANIPYYTQITGTMLMGGKARIGLMYREEFPWYLRAQEFGIENPLNETINAYDKIVAAQVRRGILIDPEFSLITLPFSGLDLEKQGLLEEWFNLSMDTLPKDLKPRQLPNYKPDEYLQSWVRYTYNGPRILEVVKDRVQVNSDISLEDFSMHVRTKQLDHLGGPTDLLKNFRALDYEKILKLRKYQNLFGVAIDSYLANNVDNGSIGFVGFDDFTIDGDVVNNTIFIETLSNSDGKRKGSPESTKELEEAITSIVRLNANNLAEHLSFLDFVAIAQSNKILALKPYLKTKVAVQNLYNSLKRTTSEKETNKLKGKLAIKQVELENLLAQVPEDLLEKADQIAKFPKASVLPLSDNLIVSHAIQLSFDPDMREFVCDAAVIVQSSLGETEKQNLLMQKMQEILPKIKQYLTFIMKGGEYPSLRFKTTYTSIRNNLSMV